MKRLLIVMLLVATAAMTIASGPSSPPAGTRKVGDVIVSRSANAFVLSNGTDSVYFLTVGGQTFMYTHAAAWEFDTSLVVTGDVTNSGNLITSGYLSEGVNTMLNRAGDQISGTITLGSAGQISGNPSLGHYFSYGGFKLPVWPTVTYTTGDEGRLLWDSDDDVIRGYTGTSPITFYALRGTPAHNQAAVWDTNTAGTADDYAEFKPMTTRMLSDVAVTAPTHGQILKWDTVGTDAYKPAADADTAGGGGLVDTLADSTVDSWMISTQAWDSISTVAGADGNDTILAVGATRDTVNLVGESDNYFRVIEDGDTTLIDAPDNAMFRFNLPLACENYLGVPTNATYVGGSLGLYTAGPLLFNYGSAAGSKISFMDNTTEKWSIDGDTLRGASGTFIYGPTWRGVDIGLDYLAQGGASTGQTLKWSGTTWAPANDSVGTGGSGLWTASGTDVQWFALTGDSLILTLDTVGVDSMKIRSNAPLVIEGGAGTPVFDFGDSTLDSTTFYRILADINDPWDSTEAVDQIGWVLGSDVIRTDDTDDRVMIGSSSSDMGKLGVRLSKASAWSGAHLNSPDSIYLSLFNAATDDSSGSFMALACGATSTGYALVGARRGGPDSVTLEFWTEVGGTVTRRGYFGFDGSFNLTGNIVFPSTQTVDGVDVSVLSTTVGLIADDTTSWKTAVTTLGLVTDDTTSWKTAVTTLGLVTDDTASWKEAATRAGLIVDDTTSWKTAVTTLGLVTDDTTSWKTAVTTLGLVTDDTTNFKTAYGWGNHASAGYLTAALYDDSLKSQLNVMDVEFLRWGRPGVLAPGDSVTQYGQYSTGFDMWNAMTEFAAVDQVDTIEAALILPQGVTRADSLFFEYMVSDSVADSVKIDQIEVFYGAFGSVSDTLTISTTDLSPADANLTTAAIALSSNACDARDKIMVRWIVEGDTGENIKILTAFVRCSRIEP